MKITVLYNKVNNEFREDDMDTFLSANEVAEGLEKSGHKVTLMGVSAGEIDMVMNIKSDLVFNLVEWTGEFTALGVKATKLLETSGKIFTGSDHRGYLLSADKTAMKKMMKQANISTPHFQIFETGKEKIDKSFNYPVIIKPTYEHCGVGIDQNSLACDQKEIREKVEVLIQRYRQPILVEEFIEGREIHVTILETNGKPEVLPYAEVVFDKSSGLNQILTFDCKWKEDTYEYKMAKMVPAVLDKKLNMKIKKIAEKSYTVLGGRDYPRLDLRIRGDEVFVLEINNNPGIDYSIESGIGVSARLAGMSFEQLTDHIVQNAYLRQVVKHAAVTI